MQTLRKPYLDTTLHVLRYVKGSVNKGLVFSLHNDFKISTYYDADWIACPMSRKSVMGFCIFFSPPLVLWKEKKATVSRSSTEAEYLSMAAIACELQWMVYLLQEFQIQQLLLIALHCDNKATQHITANPIFYERTLHLEIDWHIVRNQLSKGFISLVYVASKNHLADLFTKSISSTCLRLLLSKMKLPYFNPSQLKGGVKRNVQNDIVEKMWQNDVVFNKAWNGTIFFE